MSDDKKKEKKPGIQFAVGDIVMVKVSDKKFDATFVHKKTDTTCYGSSLKGKPYNDNSEDTEFLREQVVANLGTSPATGSVYGQNLELYFKSMETPFGVAHFFRKSSKADKETLEEFFNKAHKALSKKGLLGFLPLTLELRPVKGKFAGHYTKKKADIPDILCLRLSPEVDTKHIFFHEYAHGIWWHLFTDKIRAKWIREYHRQVVVKKLTVKDSKALLTGLLDEYNQTLYDFKGQLEEDNQFMLKQIVLYIKKVHALSSNDIDTLILAGDEIKEFWPTTEMEISEVKSDISEYAGKDPCEYWAECFAFHMCGIAIPDRCKKLLEKSLETVAGKKGKLETES